MKLLRKKLHLPNVINTTQKTNPKTLPRSYALTLSSNNCGQAFDAIPTVTMHPNASAFDAAATGMTNTHMHSNDPVIKPSPKMPTFCVRTAYLALKWLVS